MQHFARQFAALWILSISLIATAQEADRDDGPTTRASATQRLRQAAGVTRELFDKAIVLPPAEIDALTIERGVPEDRLVLHQTRFPHPEDLAAYAKARPWSAIESEDHRDWPAAADAPALRLLLANKDPAIRALAVEALATLDLPEDAAHIAALLDDRADALPALADNSPGDAEGFGRGGFGGDKPTGIIYEQSFYPRTVRTYARQALKHLTGFRFDGKEPPGTFAEWAKTYDLGRDSLWYWTNRLVHENGGHQDFTPAPTAIHVASIKEIHALTPEVEAKIFLAGGPGNSGMRVENPFSPLFVPADVALRVSRERILELLALKQVWGDVPLDQEVRARIRNRIVYLAPQMLAKEDWPAARAAIAAAPGGDVSPVLISRLLPPGTDLTDAETREGYLSAHFHSTTETYGREVLMREMVATNLEVHRPVLEAAFYDEKQSSAMPTFREALLHELGTAPRTPLKLRLLLGLVNDSRNDALFTQPPERFDSASYRREAAAALNAFAGKELISQALVEALPKRDGAMKEFRELGNSIVFSATDRSGK